MSKQKHLSREHFDQHIAEVNAYMNKVDGSLSDNRGWDAITCELAENLRENHTGSFNLPQVFQDAMDSVWDKIMYDAKKNPQEVTKTYHTTGLITPTDLSGPRLYIETFSFLSDDKWSLNTRIGLLTNNHSIGSVLIEEKNENVIDIRQRGQFDALRDEKHKRVQWNHKTPEQGQFDALRDKPKTPEQRLEAIEHDLTEIVSVLINKDIMRAL